MGFILQHNFHLSTTSAVWACNGYVSKYWQFGISVSFADYRVHVLWHHAKQVGAADLSTWLHEEPPGLPPRPPCTSVALLQLHVHACWVRPSTYHVLISAKLVQLPSGWLLQMLHSSRRNKYRMPPFESCSLSLLCPQFGAAGVQCFTAADDWRSFGDGPWHLTNKSALHGRSGCWWVSFKILILVLYATQS